MVLIRGVVVKTFVSWFSWFSWLLPQNSGIRSGRVRPRQGTEICNFGALSPLEALHWMFCFFSSIYVQFSKTSPLKSGESSKKSSGENCVKSCHICGCHGFFGPDSWYLRRELLSKCHLVVYVVLVVSRKCLGWKIHDQNPRQHRAPGQPTTLPTNESHEGSHEKNLKKPVKAFRNACP